MPGLDAPAIFYMKGKSDMKFEYKRPDDMKLEAYGKVFEIPPKTAPLIDGIMEVNREISGGDIITETNTLINGKTETTVINPPVKASVQVNALRKGIALFIGEEAAEDIFPRAELDKANVDEMSAFWFVLNEISNKETEAVIAKYAPKSREEIKVSSNPKK